MPKSFADPARAISLFLLTVIFSVGVLSQETKDELKNSSSGGSLAAASPPPQTGGAGDARNELSVQGGFAPDIDRVFGGSRRSKFGFAAVQYARVLAEGESAALKYTIDFIPLAVVNYDRQQVVQTAPGTFVTERNNTTAYGVGLTPVGFQLNFRRRKKVQPFLTAGAGLLYFNEPIPDDRSPVFPNRVGRSFNFTLAGGGGLEFAREEGRSFTVGFKFHHISNASTGNINPGYDQNLFYFGYTFKKW